MTADRELHIIYFTEAGGALAEVLRGSLEDRSPVTVTCGKGILKAWTEEHFRRGNVLLFIGACGIAVRAIAPYMEGKDKDPAVLVADEKGQNVIPVLSGHLGGANEWAEKLAKITGGQAVLTTATDVNGMFAVDVFADRNGLQIDDLRKAGGFTARLLQDKRGSLFIPGKYVGEIHVTGEIPAELKVIDHLDGEPELENAAMITPDSCEGDSLHLIPRCIVLGMGCRRGKSVEELMGLAFETLEQLGLDRRSVCALASIDVKRDEPGLLSLAEALDVPFQTFSARQLENETMDHWTFEESERVREAVGVGNVCERAVAAAGASRMLLGKTAREGMTISVGIRPVELFLSAAEENDKAGISPETGRNDPKGHLFVVGIGPGNREGMTGQAEEALKQSDTIVGYTVYNELVKPWFPDKRYLTTPMTGEEARCRVALEEAAAGHTVSLICSGDPGVYGMAGLVLEMAESSAADVEIEIVSGVTAALSGAALLGAPLVHDFAVISLSDRLTPWELIGKRLRGAAGADLCIVLYNPSSRGRKEHLHRAAQILMEILPESRICGIADRIGREGEKTRVMTLKELAEAETDMFSTVFIGNSSTKRLGDKIVTPRGYRTEKE